MSWRDGCWHGTMTTGPAGEEGWECPLVQGAESMGH